MHGLSSHIARLAIALYIVAVLIGVGAGAQLWLFTNALLVVLVLTTVIAGLVFWLGRVYGNDREDMNRMAEERRRSRAVINTQHRGYCLFNTEGLLLETAGAHTLLGIQKLNHFDDLVKAVRDGADLLSMFRQLQQTGEPFAMNTISVKGRPVTVRGVRQPGAKPDETLDVVWVRDYSEIQARLDKASDEVKTAHTNAGKVYSILDRCGFPVWIMGDDLKIVWCNSMYAQAVDAAREDVIERQIELFPHNIQPGTRALASRALGTGQPQTERHHLVVNGQRRLVEVTKAALEPEGESRSQIMGYAIDVTAEEEKDEALQRHTLAHNEVLENLATPIAVYGSDQRLEFYNRSYVRLWDHDENFLQSKPTLGEIMEDLRVRRRVPEYADFQRYKRERTALFTSLLEPREDMMHMPDGTALRIVTVPHPFGGLMFVHEDVTDKLALESSYNTLIAVQRETLDNLAEGIAVFGSDGRLKLSNPAFSRIWKMPQEDLESEPHISDLLERMKPFYHYDNWAKFKGEMISYTLDRTARAGRLDRADGAVIEFSTVPLPDGAVLNSYLDVTDTVKVEQALRASNAALATADRLKSEFVANVSYQLRTPLNTITGFAEILSNQYFGTLNERQLEYARTMMESSKRLKALIDDVLDLATIEAGRMMLDRRSVQVSQLLQAVSHLIGERARQQSLEIVVDCDAAVGSIEVDEKRIKQVLFNLVSNAIQYTPPGGRIVLQGRRQEQWVTLNVVDNGIGISSQDQERIWGKFERANPQARQSGAGLGLALVRSFVELHGGRIELKSQLNQGTTITCILPVRMPETQTADRRLAAE